MAAVALVLELRNHYTIFEGLFKYDQGSCWGATELFFKPFAGPSARWSTTSTTTDESRRNKTLRQQQQSLKTQSASYTCKCNCFHPFLSGTTFIKTIHILQKLGKWTVFENLLKSRIQHCERSELRLHFEWTKVNQHCQKWSILGSLR